MFAAPLQAARVDNAGVNTPPELSVQDAKNRGSYDKALSQLNDFMRHKQVVLSYEDIVDRFQVYKQGVSRQEMGETIFHMYSKIGPRPSKKYFGDREIEAEKAAAALKAQEAAQAQDAAQQAVFAQALAAAKAQAQSGTKTYVNSQGNTVESPDSNPAGATAECRDGSYSKSQSRRGTCSSHGGVASWL